MQSARHRRSVEVFACTSREIRLNYQKLCCKIYNSQRRRLSVQTGQVIDGSGSRQELVFGPADAIGYQIASLVNNWVNIGTTPSATANQALIWQLSACHLVVIHVWVGTSAYRSAGQSIRVQHSQQQQQLDEAADPTGSSIKC